MHKTSLLNKITLSSDNLGIAASSLCALHCIATPFLFVAKACTTTCCADTPLWWMLIDYLFLIISFTAIYYTTKNTRIYWLKFSLWISWIVLLLTIINHSLNIISLSESFIYFPAGTIIILHFYNLQFCTCKNETCCQKE